MLEPKSIKSSCPKPCPFHIHNRWLSRLALTVAIFATSRRTGAIDPTLAQDFIASLMRPHRFLSRLRLPLLRRRRERLLLLRFLESHAELLLARPGLRRRLRSRLRLRSLPPPPKTRLQERNEWRPDRLSLAPEPVLAPERGPDLDSAPKNGQKLDTTSEIKHERPTNLWSPFLEPRASDLQIPFRGVGRSAATPAFPLHELRLEHHAIDDHLPSVHRLHRPLGGLWG